MDALICKSKHTIDLERTVLSHGWVQLPPFNWDAEQQELSRRERVGKQIGTIIVSQISRRQLAITMPDRFGSRQRDALESRVRRSLMLDWNPAKAIDLAINQNPLVAKYMKCGGGRFLRGSNFFEDFYKTVCTINTSWLNTIRMTRALANLNDDGCAASPHDISSLAPSKLQKLCGLGYRAEILHKITIKLLSLGIIDEDGNLLVDEVERETMLGFKGIGPYGADHLRILQADFSRIPVDSEVSSYCRKELDIIDADINESFESWGNFRFLGYKVGRILRHRNWIDD